jgi:hypothetical protein
MSARGHVRILGFATAAWFAFWLLGLPSYYLQYSRTAMIAFSVALLPPIIALSYVLLRRVSRARRLSRAGWLAFYFSVPLALYDWVYCGVYLGYGPRFFSVFWYLTVFYVVPWLVLPAAAAHLNVRDRSTTHVVAV